MRRSGVLLLLVGLLPGPLLTGLAMVRMFLADGASDASAESLIATALTLSAATLPLALVGLAMLIVASVRR